ncbi:MAG TPA: hypothetical protein VN969_21975 [Streptosporangiaceae bacterium]|jgi:hypothetical protein|nr:hypothetical protein [Streptosporangiaceae bacterium]
MAEIDRRHYVGADHRAAVIRGSSLVLELPAKSFTLIEGGLAS